MICERQRWEHTNDVREASMFHRFEQVTQRAIISKIGLMTSGPGRVRTWDSMLTERERVEARKANEERDAAYELLKEHGLLIGADGARPMDQMLKRPDTPAGSQLSGPSED